MFNTSGFQGECSFCYSNIYDGSIILCECSTEYCLLHKERHLFPHKSIRISLSNSSVEVEGETEDKERVREELTRKLETPRDKKKKECTHINSNLLPVKLEGKKCSASCEIDNNTWMCFFCSKIFCGRIQYGVEGKGHFQEHHKSTDHFLALRTDSLDKKKKTAEIFCYLCDEMIENNHLIDLVISSEDTNSTNTKASSLQEIEEKLNSEKQEETETEKEKFPYIELEKSGGITNLGNTCYISASLMGISFALQKETKRLESFPGTDQCDLPGKCFACQLEKVIKRCRESQERSSPSFSIENFWNCLQSIHPKYSLNIQQDATEFLEDLLSTVEVYDSIGHFSLLSELFRIEVEISTKCNNCSNRTTEKETRKVFYLHNRSIQDCAVEIEELTATCSCGETKKERITKISSFPSILLVQQNPSTKESPQDTITIQGRKYLLKAALLYKGTQKAGHYAAQINHSNRRLTPADKPDGKAASNKADGKADESTEKKSSKKRKKEKDASSNTLSNPSSITDPWIVFDDEIVGVSELLREWVTLMFYVREEEKT